MWLAEKSGTGGETLYRSHAQSFGPKKVRMVGGRNSGWRKVVESYSGRRTAKVGNAVTKAVERFGGCVRICLGRLREDE